MKKALVLLAAPVLVAGVWACQANGAMSFEHWIALFDRQSLAGWTISTENGHGDTQAWTIDDGAITGTQDKPGNGGIVYSDQAFGDFVLELEINPDWGLDSGIFLRSTPSGKCYQIMVDYYEGGNVGGIYGEGIGGFNVRSDEWKEVYKNGEWNKILAVVTGNPPTIDVWLNGLHVTSFKGDERLLDDTGRIALQVHAGERYHGLKTRYRNIRIRTLD